MPHILLLRLSAPMQSWGVMSRFSIRDTAKEPSKSGVIGLLCAALGISRDEANSKNPRFAELTKLKMGVRVLKEGVPRTDYQTAVNVVKASGETPPIKTRDKHPNFTVISPRHYLADADFLVGLESNELPLLEELQSVLQNPKWQLFLGRKAFVPDLPVYFRERDGLITTDESLEDYLKSGALTELIEQYDEKLDRKRFEDSLRKRLIIESDDGSETRQDVPLSFAARKFTNRRVRTDFINLKIGGRDDDGDLFNEDAA